MAEPFRILVVCTGNICRSPMAQALLVDGLRRRIDASAAESVEVTSAGTEGLKDWPMEPDAVRVLADLGVGVDPFTSRALLAEHVESADLVLCATRQHRAAVVGLCPKAAARSFTVREFARLVAAVSPGDLGGGDVRERAHELTRLAVGNRGYIRAERPEDDDVADPYRQSRKAFRRAAAEIQEAVDVIVARLAGH